MSDDNPAHLRSAGCERAMVELAIESWRFQRLFGRALAKLDAGESLRFTNQHRYFIKKIDECLETIGFRLVNLEGQTYEHGSAVSALNVEDFKPEDDLIVDQMIEPVVMGKEGLLRPGTVVLRKAEK
jgi:hypothetical protein